MAPGTEFMQTLTKRLISAINKNLFSKIKKIEVIFNSGMVPGEGEHKIMPLVRKISKIKDKKDKKICIYSPDADLVALSLVINKNNIYIFQELNSSMKKLYPQYETEEFIFLNIDLVKKCLRNKLIKSLKYKKTINKRKFITDYNFLLAIGGNDFVNAMPFTKVRNQGIERVIMPIYKEYFNQNDDYLIKFSFPNNKPKISVNKELLKYIFEKLADIEDDLMKQYQIQNEKVRSGFIPSYAKDNEADMNEYEKELNRLEHFELLSPHHPLNEQYVKDFTKIDYSKDKYEWRREYYLYYFNKDINNEDEFEPFIKELCTNYLESLLFVQYYYMFGCQSWSWRNKFRTTPFPSDLYRLLDEGIIDINELSFNKGKPYTPFQQLMLILPPQLINILPKEFEKVTEEFEEFYPTEFKVDATVGKKYMYSEAILPEIQDDKLLTRIREIEKTLSSKDKKRNELKFKYIRKKI